MRHLLAACLAAAGVLVPTAARAQETVLDLSSSVDDAGPDHVRVPFEVPDGIVEIEIQHQALGEGDVLDWGLEDPDGFRGWGGGNEEPAIVGEDAASRSYLAGPLPAGTWNLIIGKALVASAPAAYTATAILREEATLEPQPERQPYAPAPALEEGARWYAGDLHVHSRESGDARPAIDEIAQFARERGLDFVELSDHNTTSQLDFLVDAQGRHPDVLLLPGVEYTTYDGHANGIGATAFVDHKIGLDGLTIDDAIAAFAAQGALFSLNHPTLALGNRCLGCEWTHDVDAADVDAVEIATGGAYPFFMDSAIALWDELCATGAHVAAIGGSDDHRAGQDLDSFQDPMGEPTTMVLAERLDAASIVEGIRRGRTVVRITQDDPMVELTSDPPLDGDAVSARRAILSATITGPVRDGLVARFVKNGTPLDEVDLGAEPEPLTLEVEPPAAGEDRYRVEILEGVQRRVVTSHVWIATGAAEPGGTTSATGSTASGDATGTGGAAGRQVEAEGDGCGCDVVGAPASSGWAAIGALLPLIARRRRRAR